MRKLWLGIAALVVVLGSSVLLAAPPRQASLFEAFILDIRIDLELLANDALGEGVRPPTWTFNADLESDTFVSDLWFDNQQLGVEIYGDISALPTEWLGLPAGMNPELIARNVRHDLELMADTIYGEGERTPGWTGASRIYQCSRTVQNLVRLLDTAYNTRPNTPQAAFNYCASLETELENELIEVVLEADGNAELPLLALALRGDLERLADEHLGLDNRPGQWTDNREEGSPTLIADTAADLSRLADDILGQGIRPEEWASIVSDSLAVSYQNLRFNLELLADLRLGEAVRPNGWQGVDPVAACNPITQGLFFVVVQQYLYEVPETISDSQFFCQLLAEDVNNVSENPPAPETILQEQQADESRFLGESEYAFSYLDVSALQYMGVMPPGTQFRAWYRNFNESSMMFVSGADFAVFIDHRWTTMTQEVFNTLPTLDGVLPLTFCDAFWCNGPGPTPTPTGGSAVELLANAQTPPPTLAAPGELGAAEGLLQVSWDHIRVNYLLDIPETARVQVTLEICADPSQVACEPVLSVFDTAINSFFPVVSQFNGLNVYEFSYGYQDGLIIEGSNYVSPDVWISDPTVR